MESMLFCQVGKEGLPREVGRGYRIVRLPLIETQTQPGYVTDARRLATSLGTGWDDLACDLHHVACALSAADRYFASGAIFEPPRVLRLAVGVRHADRWKELAPDLSALVRELGGDDLEFHPVPTRTLFAAGSATSPLLEAPPPDCVCLFSGGADSFAGADHLFAQGRQPVLVGHAVGPISKRQQELWAALRQAYRAPDCRLLQVHARPYRAASAARGRNAGWRHRDNRYRLRAFGFLSTAAIVARALGTDDVFMCENGLVAAAIAFAPEEEGNLPRPAVPTFLRKMQEFLRKVLQNNSLRVRNPFQYLTKGQILSGVEKAKLRVALTRTVSCWASGNHGNKNCGRCVPCLFRYLAFDEAGMGTGLPTGVKIIPTGKRWQEWDSPTSPRLRRLRSYCERASEPAGRWQHLSLEPVVVEALDVTGGSLQSEANAVDQDALDAAAPEKVAAVVQTFAEYVLRRLPDETPTAR